MRHSNEAAEDSLPGKKKEMEWNNTDNNAFYEAVKAEGLQQLAEKAGLTTCCDLKLLEPYWSKVNSILEVGAGYGRVIDYLLEHQFQGKITAIERCNMMFQHIKKKYDDCENIKILHKDVRYLDDVDIRVDLILMLWSGISDFPPKEQASIIEKLIMFLQPKGKLIIDTLTSNIVPLHAKKDKIRFYSMEINKATIHVHLPTNMEIESYAKKSKFSHISHNEYLTDTNRRRWLHILS